MLTNAGVRLSCGLWALSHHSPTHEYSQVVARSFCAKTWPVFPGSVAFDLRSLFVFTVTSCTMRMSESRDTVKILLRLHVHPNHEFGSHLGGTQVPSVP